MKIVECGNSWLIEDQLNAELLNEIKCFFDNHLEFLYKDKKGYSTKGKNSEQYWIQKNGKDKFYYSNNEYKNIEQKFRKEIHGRLKAASLLRNEEIELYQSSSWSVIGDEGSYHTVHNHSTEGRMDGIVTVLYLNVPKSICDNSSNSIFLIFNVEPSVNFINSTCPSIYNVDPKDGTLLIFPPHIPHGTYPQTKGIRQTFNVDYVFKYKNKTINDISYV